MKTEKQEKWKTKIGKWRKQKQERLEWGKMHKKEIHFDQLDKSDDGNNRERIKRQTVYWKHP